MSSVIIAGNTSGSVTLAAPDVAGTTTLTLPATSGTVLTTTGGVAPGTSGNVLTSNGTTWTSAAPSGGVTSLNGQTGTITNTDYGAIGSYVIAAENTYTTGLERLPNVTVAGSTLFRDGAAAGGNACFISTANNGVIESATAISLGLSGTWRRLTRSTNSTSFASSASNLYVRIS